MTPVETWLAQDWLRGRAAICKALRIDHDDPASVYATAPFTILSDDGANWIAALVGMRPCLSVDAIRAWDEAAAGPVILWNPRTNKLRILGEAASASIAIVPDHADRLTVYADAYSFFRAWADHRADIFASIKAAQSNPHRITPAEPADGGIPGALIVGSVEKAAPQLFDALHLLAGPGIDPAELKRSIYRAARIPTVEAAPDYRIAA